MAVLFRCSGEIFEFFMSFSVSEYAGFKKHTYVSNVYIYFFEIASSAKSKGEKPWRKVPLRMLVYFRRAPLSKPAYFIYRSHIK